MRVVKLHEVRYLAQGDVVKYVGTEVEDFPTPWGTEKIHYHGKLFEVYKPQIINGRIALLSLDEDDPDVCLPVADLILVEKTRRTEADNFCPFCDGHHTKHRPQDRPNGYEFYCLDCGHEWDEANDEYNRSLGL